MPEWIHNRAEHLLAKNPSMNKSTAFAIATQQGHKMGKSPKGYGTKKGKKVARAKYDKPRKEYVRGANPGKLNSPKLAEVGLEEGLIAGGGAALGLGLGALGSKFRGARAAAKKAKLLKTPNIRPGATPRLEWAGEVSKLDPASQKAIMENPLVSQGGIAPEMALMHIRQSMKPGDKIVDFLARQKTPQVTSKIGSVLPGFLDELTKIAISQSDNPYMLDQIGEGKIRPKRAAAPDPKFRVKQAMFPTSPTPMGSSGMDAQKRLAKSQKVGTPAAPKPPKPKGMPKLSFAASGFSGPLSMGGFPQASGQAARVNPPTHIMDPHLKTAGPPSEKKAIKEAAARMAKWAGIPLTPAGRLAASRKEGKPKLTGFSGPSIAGVAKPVGFSNVVPGAGKNRI